MIEEILPPAVVAEEAFEDRADVTLFPEEAVCVARAVPRRRTEFATTRHCARAALRRLGVAAVPIVPDRRGAPGWPPGTVGSMTHCDGYRAAAIAQRRDVAAVGIDAEPHDRLPQDVLRLVTVPAERLMLERLAATRPDVHWDRLLFSAKETVYKTWYPLTRRWLGFEEVEVVIDARDRRFVAHLLVPGPTVAGRRRERFEGRYVVRGGLVATAIALAA